MLDRAHSRAEKATGKITNHEPRKKKDFKAAGVAPDPSATVSPLTLKKQAEKEARLSESIKEVQSILMKHFEGKGAKGHDERATEPLVSSFEAEIDLLPRAMRQQEIEEAAHKEHIASGNSAGESLSNGPGSSLLSHVASVLHIGGTTSIQDPAHHVSRFKLPG